MRFGSLFAGIGGFDLGLERAGFSCAWQVEVDPYCRRVLERHWPGVHRRGDVRLVDPADLERIDLIVGGFPCQDISTAGKGAGITGRRSGLWREMLRLVSGLRPRWVVAENVPALRTRGADVVCGDLEAEGYAVWPVVVGAWAVGAPHRRERVWVIGRRVDDAYPGRRGRADGTLSPGRNVAGGAGGSRLADAGCGVRSGRTVANAAQRLATRDPRVADGHDEGRERERRGGLLDGERAAPGDDADGRDRWPARPGEPQHEWEAPRTIEPGVGGAAHGLSRRLALKALGNAVVPQVAEAIGRTIRALEE